MKPMFKYLLIAGLFSTSAAIAAVKFPSNLNWKMMPQVSYNFPVKTGTPELRATSDSIWKSKIPKETAAFVLLSSVETKENQYIFTMLDSTFAGCVPPPNGDGTDTAMPLYSTCSMRVIQKNKITKKTTTQEIKDFCYLSLNCDPEELAKNHTKFAFDSKTNTAYFKTIMYGKHARECDREIRLK